VGGRAEKKVGDAPEAIEGSSQRKLRRWYGITWFEPSGQKNKTQNPVNNCIPRKRKRRSLWVSSAPPDAKLGTYCHQRQPGKWKGRPRGGIKKGSKPRKEANGEGKGFDIPAIKCRPCYWHNSKKKKTFNRQKKTLNKKQPQKNTLRTLFNKTNR